MLYYFPANLVFQGITAARQSNNQFNADTNIVEFLRTGDVDSDALQPLGLVFPNKFISVELLLRSDRGVMASLRRPLPDEALQFASSVG